MMGERAVTQEGSPPVARVLADSAALRREALSDVGGRSASSRGLRRGRVVRCRTRQSCRQTRRARLREGPIAPASGVRSHPLERCGYNLTPLGVSPRLTVARRSAAAFDWAITWSPLIGLTVVSRSPWKTMVGTAALPCRRDPPAMEPPCRIAAKAEGTSLAAPQASPEWTPIAA